MNVALSIDEKPGALHVFAALDIIVLVMLLGFVATTLVHRAGVTVAMPNSEVRFRASDDAVVLTIKGAVDPVFYLGPKRVAEDRLVESLRNLRDQKGVRMILIRADSRLPATWQRRLSVLVLSEGLECGLLAEPVSAGVIQ